MKIRKNIPCKNRSHRCLKTEIADFIRFGSVLTKKSRKTDPCPSLKNCHMLLRQNIQQWEIVLYNNMEYEIKKDRYNAFFFRRDSFTPPHTRGMVFTASLRCQVALMLSAWLVLCWALTFNFYIENLRLDELLKENMDINRIFLTSQAKSLKWECYLMNKCFLKFNKI